LESAKAARYYLPELCQQKELQQLHLWQGQHQLHRLRPRLQEEQNRQLQSPQHLQELQSQPAMQRQRNRWE
jgi:hypothetical protein